MDKLLNWLFQHTSDGATYLQVIIIGLLICFTMYALYKTLEEIIDIQNEEDID